jgi:hypothetical protein
VWTLICSAHAEKTVAAGAVRLKGIALALSLIYYKTTGNVYIGKAGKIKLTEQV